ncbi:MAG: tetratricopeptide repeat protein [Bacteroidetes bacterium]|nr:tetratricopeptide repeat protein [Bacteroidota bacterium]
MKTFSVGIVMLFCICSSHAQSTKIFIKKAQAATDEHNYDLAISYLDKAIILDSNNTSLYLAKGELHIVMEKYTEAIADLQRATSIDSTNYKAYISRGNLFMKYQMMPEAISDFNKALLYAHEDTTVRHLWVIRASAKIGMRNFESAYKDLKYIYTLDSIHTEVLSTLAWSCLYTGRQSEALGYLLKAHELDPKERTNITNIGFVYQNIGEYAKSLPYFDQAIRLEPKEAYAYSNRGYSHLKLGHTDAAMKDISRSIELDPSNSYAFRNRALVFLEMKKYADACEDLHTALSKGYTAMYGSEVQDLIDQNCKLFK